MARTRRRRADPARPVAVGVGARPGTGRGPPAGQARQLREAAAGGEGLRERDLLAGAGLPVAPRMPIAPKTLDDLAWPALCAGSAGARTRPRASGWPGRSCPPTIRRSRARASARWPRRGCCARSRSRSPSAPSRTWRRRWTAPPARGCSSRRRSSPSPIRSSRRGSCDGTSPRGRRAARARGAHGAPPRARPRVRADPRRLRRERPPRGPRQRRPRRVAPPRRDPARGAAGEARRAPRLARAGPLPAGPLLHPARRPLRAAGARRPAPAGAGHRARHVGERRHRVHRAGAGGEPQQLAEAGRAGGARGGAAHPARAVGVRARRRRPHPHDARRACGARPRRWRRCLRR
ncbi:MAG: hypothetical protein MZV63_14130 [Marinilabiliales bacterium]|nr:hypothetical protein [Marinilabiliales bacterium]